MADHLKLKDNPATLKLLSSFSKRLFLLVKVRRLDRSPYKGASNAPVSIWNLP